MKKLDRLQAFLEALVPGRARAAGLPLLGNHYLRGITTCCLSFTNLVRFLVLAEV